MLDVVAAIKTAWGLDNTLKNVPLWYGGAPEQSTFPYSIIKIVGGTSTTDAFPTLYIEDTIIEIEIYQNEIADCLTIGAAAEKLLDRKTLSINNGTWMGCWRMSRCMNSMSNTLDGKSSYSLWIRWRVRVDRSY
jgi:fructose-1,6-bisphosphatase/sedoheptulose 1,7-bisphosphatase-like protein